MFLDFFAASEKNKFKSFDFVVVERAYHVGKDRNIFGRNFRRLRKCVDPTFSKNIVQDEKKKLRIVWRE